MPPAEITERALSAPTPQPDRDQDLAEQLREELRERERRKIQEALDECQGNQTRAAELLGISRRTLVTKLGELGFPRPRKR